MGRPHLTESERAIEARAERWLLDGPDTHTARVAALLLAVLDSLSRARAELAAVRVASEEARAALRGEERARIAAIIDNAIMAEGIAADAATTPIGCRQHRYAAGVLRDLADEIESGAHIVVPEVPDVA